MYVLDGAGRGGCGCWDSVGEEGEDFEFEFERERRDAEDGGRDFEKIESKLEAGAGRPDGVEEVDPERARVFWITWVGSGLVDEEEDSTGRVEVRVDTDDVADVIDDADDASCVRLAVGVTIRD